MSTEITTPMLPESVSEATVLAWHKEVGEPFKRDELLIELETEKIVLEIPAPDDGVLTEIRKGAGETVVEGDVLGAIGNGTVAAVPETSEKTEATQATLEEVVQSAEPAPEPQPVPEMQPKTGGQPSPAALVLASEKGIDISILVGTGRDGRITKADVMQAVEAESEAESVSDPVASTPQLLPAEQPDKPQPTVAAEPPVVVSDPAAGERGVKRQPMSRIRRTIAARLVQAQQTAALLTTFNEVDMSAVMALRTKHREDFESRHGTRLGFMSFFVKAAVESLKAVPAVNAIIEGDEIVYHDFCDIGIAVSSPRGLVVPILRDAHLMGFGEIEKTIRDFGERAKSGSLTLDELTGGTFTITNGGVFGSLVSTPIVNPPQSAILGMHKIQERPVVENGEVVIRPMMYLALTYDHRIIDGREAVTFLVGIKEGLEDPSRILLEL